MVWAHSDLKERVLLYPTPHIPTQPLDCCYGRHHNIQDEFPAVRKVNVHVEQNVLAKLCTVSDLIKITRINLELLQGRKLSFVTFFKQNSTQCLRDTQAQSLGLYSPSG